MRTEISKLKEEFSKRSTLPPSSLVLDPELDAIRRTVVLNGFEHFTKEEAMELIVQEMFGNLVGLDVDGSYNKSWRTNEYFLRFESTEAKRKFMSPVKSPDKHNGLSIHVNHEKTQQDKQT